MLGKSIPRWRVQLIREPAETYAYFSSVESVAPHFAFLKAQTVESFYVAFLDTRNGLIGMQEVSRGLVDQALVSPREIFQAAILANCTRILLIHAHPSGDATPSHQDRTLTQTLVQAGALLGIEVLDHVIIGDPDFYSFRAAGELTSTNRV